MPSHLETLEQRPLPLVRKHTLLYKIPPEGRGSGQIESLYSLLQRLAFEHSLSVKNLVRITLAGNSDVLAALSKGHGEPNSVEALASALCPWAGGWDKEAGFWLIGTSLGASRWASGLEIATGNENLQSCTLTGLSSIVSPAKLISPFKRICVDCLRDDVATSQTPYERLLWRIEPVRCCPIHRRCLLPTKCGRPRRGSQSFDFRIQHPGACGQCGALGFSCMVANETAPELPELWCAEQCAQVLIALGGWWQPSPAGMRHSVQQRMDTTGGLQAFAARVGGPKSNFSRWLHHARSRMALEQLIDIAWIEGVSLAALLQGRWEPINMPSGFRLPLRQRRSTKRVDHCQLRQAMADGIKEGKTAKAVARTIRADRSTLRRHEDLYTELCASSQARRHLEEEGRRLSALVEAERVAQLLFCEGRTLSLRNASALSGSQWYPTQLRARYLRIIASVFANGKPPERHCVVDEMLKMVLEVAMRLRVQLTSASASLRTSPERNSR